MDKRLKNSKKNLNKQFLGIRDRRYRRKVINKIFRISRDVESFIKILARRGNEKRHYCSFFKLKIKISSLFSVLRFSCSLAFTSLCV